MSTTKTSALEEHMLARYRGRLAAREQVPDHIEAASRLSAFKRICQTVGQPPPSPPTLRGSIGAIVLTPIIRSLFWLLPPLRSAFRLLSEVVEDQSAALRRLEARSNQEFDLLVEELENRADNLRLTLLQRLTAAEADINVRMKNLEGIWEHKWSMPPRESGPDRPPAPGGHRTRTEDPAAEQFHYAFQEAFRGGREDIRNRFSVYLDYLPPMQPASSGLHVLDLGCGRGDWLELLGERGIPAYGVDSNELMIQACRSHGLRAECDDLLAYVERVPDASAPCITAFHVVEHLDVRELFLFVTHAHRVLKPGGALILETPNPENLAVGAHKFYQDLTHKHPIPPPTLTFLLEHFGFTDLQVLRLHPHEKPAAPHAELEELYFYLNGPQDYGVIARKPNVLQ